MTAVVRDAGAADLPAILAIYNDAVLTSTASWDHEPVTLADRRSRLDAARANGWTLVVAESAGRVVGFGAWAPFRSKLGWSRTMEHSVYVDAAARGTGVGRLLLQHLVASARAAGVHALIGVLDASNAASVALHTSQGFRQVGLLPQAGFKFGRWLDASLWQLLLDDAPEP